MASDSDPRLTDLWTELEARWPENRIEPTSLAVTENADATLAAQGTLRTVD